MSRIRSTDTKPEILVRKYLHKAGFRFRLHRSGLPGRPDIVFPGIKKVIFVNGCFWHGHNHCKYFVIPKTRRDWWLGKIQANRKRDRKNSRELRELGWKVHVIYECELKSDPRMTAALLKAISFLENKE